MLHKSQLGMRERKGIIVTQILLLLLLVPLPLPTGGWLLTPVPRIYHSIADNSVSVTRIDKTAPCALESTKISPEHSAPTISFPGGGIYFYWQAGAVTYLRETYDLDQACFLGASAGALTATLAACNVDFLEATDVAIALCNENKVWDRKLGLAGVWGPIVRAWLETLLPKNTADLCHHRVFLYVTLCDLRTFPYKRLRVADYETKEDVIEACLASVHIPLFMDGRFRARIRGNPCIDGSFLMRDKDLYLKPHLPTVVLDHSRDPALGIQGPTDFVSLVSPDGLKRMIQMGYDYAAKQDEAGAYSVLEELRRRPAARDELSQLRQ